MTTNRGDAIASPRFRVVWGRVRNRGCPGYSRRVSETSTARRPIFLVGMMGAGKTTVGRVLAQRLGREFIDLDAHIVAAAGRSISEIFEAEGEAGFRARERTSLQAVAGGDAVVALGGGALTQADVAATVARSGQSVYLRATPEQLVKRLTGRRDRPLLAGLDARGRLERISALLAERREAYEAAQWAIDAGDRDVDAIVAEIVETALGG